jgi:tetratricopeptide (TPR) repeat protein
MATSTNSDSEEKQNAIQITDFLDNVIPDNTSILVTSRERINNLSNEESIDLEGLDTGDSMKLFNAYLRPIFKDPKGNAKNQIEEILQKTEGHPLSIEIIAKNIRSLNQLQNTTDNLSGLQIDPTQSEKRFQTLRASFDYTVNRLNKNLQELLNKLAFFNSPFPISAPVEIFGANENEILDLYDRSLLTLIDSDERYGKVQDPDYWLYNFHPAIRDYIEDKMKENKSYDDLALEHGEKFSEYYYNLLSTTYDLIGKVNHRSAFARFNIIYQGGDNDFDRSINLTKNPDLRVSILNMLGLIMRTIGLREEALVYHERALEKDEELNRDRLGADYRKIGIVYQVMGNHEKALSYFEKALAFHERRGMQRGIARDYRHSGIVYRLMGHN